VTSFGRVISVRGSLARVGLLATGQTPVSEVRATVGRFISIRCGASTIIAMITEVSCEDLTNSDSYIATASVDLLGEILGGERPKFQRGVTNYPTIGDAVDLVTAQDLRTVYTSSDPQEVQRLLSTWRARYVVVGPLEKKDYGETAFPARAAFKQVFSEDGTELYEVGS